MARLDLAAMYGNPMQYFWGGGGWSWGLGFQNPSTACWKLAFLSWAALHVHLCSSCHLHVLISHALAVMASTHLTTHALHGRHHSHKNTDTRTRLRYHWRKAGITCWSLATLPRKTSTPSPRQQASSPVLYMRVCCSSPPLKGLGTKRSPVMTGWPL